MTTNDNAFIAKLPWVGNHHSDADLFRQCDRYIRSLTDRDQQKAALHDMVLYGMGIDELVTDGMFEEYLAFGAMQ